MKNFVKTLLTAVINFFLWIIPGKKRKAAFLSFVSSTFMNSDNSVEYDADHDMYWLKDKSQYLYLVKKPYFNFSKNKLYKSIERIACQYYKPKKGDIIINVGAGIGTETLYFDEKTENCGKIYSIEASRSSHEKLVELCTKNGIKTSENLNLAITNQNQKLWIEETDNYQVYAVNKNSKGIEVDGVSLDYFVQEKAIKNIDFLKVNIEGSELQMIDGMKDTIKITKNIAVSCHDFLFGEDQKIRTKMSEFLKDNNFEVSYNNTGHKVVDSWVYGKKI